MSPTSSLPLLLGAARPVEEPTGGPASVVQALVEACEAAGVELQVSVGSVAVVPDDGAVRGVKTTAGVMDAERVVWARAPTELFAGLPMMSVAMADLEAARHIRERPVTSQVALALSSWPDEFPVERLRLTTDVVGLERAFDTVKRRELSSDPPLDIWTPSVTRSGLAPAGGHVMCVSAFGLVSGDSERVAQAVLGQLALVWPGFADHVLGYQVVGAEQCRALHGSPHPLAGEVALDQWWSNRPFPSLKGAAPLDGLALCGPGVHGAKGTSGLRAAAAVLGR